MDWIRQEFFDRWFDKELNNCEIYFELFVILVINPFGNIDEVRDGGGFLFDRSFFIMIGNKVNVIADG